MNLFTKAKHTGLDHGNKQLNLFNNIAIKNRVPYSEVKIPGRPQEKDIEMHFLSTYFPSADDERRIHTEFR